MKPVPCKSGDRIETLPHVGVARGVLLAHVEVDYHGREVWRWKARVTLPSGEEETVFLMRKDFDVLQEGPPLDLEEAAAARRAKRRGGRA